MPSNLDQLINQYIIAKKCSDDAKEILLAAENCILTEVKDELKKGTNKFGNLSIICSNNPKWNQLELMVARSAWPSSIQWPFESEYVPDNKSISYIEANNPELFKLLDAARTLSPKKPQFKIKGEKE